MCYHKNRHTQSVFTIPAVCVIVGSLPTHNCADDLYSLIVDLLVNILTSAEATMIRSQSVDIVTAGQAFHWFEPSSARAEFIRILKPRGWVVLIWNMTRTDTPFLKEYDEFWRVDLRGAHEARDGNESLVKIFFDVAHYEKVTLEGMRYDLTLDEFIGRILSISAAIQPGEAGYETFIQKVRGMFERHQQNNLVTMSYDTEVFFGQLVM